MTEFRLIEPEESTISFHGAFLHKLDTKYRFTLPHRWQSNITEVLCYVGHPDFEVVAFDKRDVQKECIYVLPPTQANSLYRRYKEIASKDSATAEHIKIYFGNWGEYLPVDKIGRIQIPSNFAKEAGLQFEVELVGRLDRFEIWSPKRFEATLESDEMLSPIAIAFNL